MNTKLKFLSDTKDVSIGLTREKRSVYPMSYFIFGSKAKPIQTVACAWIGILSIEKLFKEGLPVDIIRNNWLPISKQVGQILDHCEKNDHEYPVIAYLNKCLWIGFEKDLRELGAREYNEL